MLRILDIIFFIYFLSHIPISLLMDSQMVFPECLYPQKLIDMKLWYCDTFKDPLVRNPPDWYFSLALCEFLLQFPFFFVATYGFYKGAAQCRWLRLPCIVYGAHVATTLIPIIFHVLTHDFSNYEYPAPTTPKERGVLLCFYGPYFVIPLMIMLDAIFSPAYKQDKELQHSPPKTKKKK